MFSSSELEEGKDGVWHLIRSAVVFMSPHDCTPIVTDNSDVLAVNPLPTMVMMVPPKKKEQKIHHICCVF